MRFEFASNTLSTQHTHTPHFPPTSLLPIFPPRYSTNRVSAFSPPSNCCSLLSASLASAPCRYPSLTKMSEAQGRSELFGAVGVGVRRRKRHDALNASSTSSAQRGDDDTAQVSRSLARTRAMLQNELDRVDTVATTIDEDKRAIERVAEDYLSVEGVAAGARKVLRSLENREVKENVALWAAFSFYVAVVVWIVFSRIRIPFLLW
mmetsp:Transcript_6252/g.11851  ORF Transcript_6252/g.11851 Transcript_6252/m.11851 type:complete len:206 (+) Transcript_6252:1-618(+)